MRWVGRVGVELAGAARLVLPRVIRPLAGAEGVGDDRELHALRVEKAAVGGGGRADWNSLSARATATITERGKRVLRERNKGESRRKRRSVKRT